MRTLERAWDGPFKTPPLQQPISVGWVFLKVLETLWRTFLILCVVVTVFLGFVWWSERNPLSSGISVELSPSTDYCQRKGWPITAHIVNKTRKTIGELGLQFRVYPQGTSQDVANGLSSPELHNILTPGQSLDWCFAMPEVEAGATGPYTVAADVTYASELPKNVPVTATPTPPLIKVVERPTG